MKLLSWIGSLITFAIGCFLGILLYDTVSGYVAAKDAKKLEGTTNSN